MPVKPESTKNLLLRLDPELAGRLQTVADVEGRAAGLQFPELEQFSSTGAEDEHALVCD
jgi:hypothetical protein